MDQIMTAMDVFPTFMDAVGIEPGEHFPWDGQSLWPSIADGAAAPRTEDVFFVSETPIYGEFHLTVFNEEWKLMQEVIQDQVTTTVTNHLFRIAEDPNEYNNLASSPSRHRAGLRGPHPPLARPLSHPGHPLGAGAAARLAGAQGLGLLSTPVESLQPEAAKGMAPTETINRVLDMQLGERGRLVYDCETRWYLAGLCTKNSGP